MKNMKNIIKIPLCKLQNKQLSIIEVGLQQLQGKEKI